MHFLVSVFFLRIWDELPYLGFGGLTLPVITLFLKVWPLNQQHQHHWRERNAVSDLTPELLVQNLHFNKIPRWFTCTLWFEKHSRIPQRSVKMEAQKCTVCTEKELGEERGASQVPSLAKLWCAESHSLAQYLLSFSEFHLPFFSVSFKKLIFPGCPLEFIIYFAYAGSLIFPTWYSPHLQMKFLSWAPEPCFQQCTEHLCQEAIWLSPVPSCQNIQNWACPTHSFLCLVSQISLNNSTINSASQARHLLYPDAKGVFSELHIRSQCCLLNSSVIPDHLWNYVQHLPRDRVQTQSGLAPSSVSDPEPLVSRFEPSFQRCAPLSLPPAC